MEVRVEFSPELEAEITTRAASAGTDPAAIIRELVTASIEADQLDDQEAVAGIQQGLDELTAGQGRPATEFLAELRRTPDLSREHPPPSGTRSPSSNRLTAAHAGHAGLPWFLNLKAAIASLAPFPGRCPVATESPALAREIRQRLYGTPPHTYRILFTIDSDIVQVLHIRHGRRHSASR